jgi:hypothetical protein
VWPQLPGQTRVTEYRVNDRIVVRDSYAGGAGQTGPVAATITPTAAAGTVVQGVLDVVSNTSVTGQTQVIAALPSTYTVGPAAP